jgi:argininosuccinate lyase
LSALVSDISGELLGTPITYTEEALTRVLSPRHFVNVRRTLGGPAPEETARALRVSHAQLETDRHWWKGATGALTSAERSLAERSAAL